MNAVLEEQPQAQILFVDDERAILSSLRRLFRSSDYKIHVAGSGAEGIALLEKEEIDLVVSDMRMPEMDGAAFLSTVAKRWPSTVRMLLTGYSELSSAVEAINQGKISRYLTKPWDDSDIIMSIEQALQNKRLLEEKNRLERLTAHQNEELLALNESLEEKVELRTKEIEEARQEIAVAHEALQSGYAATIETFSRMVQSRSGLTSRASVAIDARAVGHIMGLKKITCDALYNAALLCDVGKLSLSDETVTIPYTRLDASAQREYQRHPVIAEATLLSLEPLSEAADIIRHHCERMDSLGFPDSMNGSDIPLPSRILAVSKAYVDLQEQRIFDERMTAAEARKFLQSESDKRFDRKVVNHFIVWLDNPKREETDLPERKISINLLRAGNRLSRDLYDPNGVLVIAGNKIITESLLVKLRRLNESFEEPLPVYVRG
ncbi:MAG: response regulator [Granulosicoccus sp.]|nr:response regulator [Granulosicoccus sp.]